MLIQYSMSKAKIQPVPVDLKIWGNFVSIYMCTVQCQLCSQDTSDKSDSYEFMKRE